ncbi:MAG: 23S rRNA (adenine(2503)-C(2))-methyltransferase RlmN [Candidatus Goldbacteria bacterium]|nr:23S rRNA (adenine(2503)-C(2))-methyltransferase RlmN [Candidatus Goldiibacteriota bacterium]
MKNDIKAMTLQEIQEVITAAGFEKYRAQQIYEWIYKKKAQSTDDFKNIPAKVREYLEANYDFFLPEIIKQQESEIDGTKKLLLQLDEDTKIETVILNDEDRYTACISSQAGCGCGCAFCATATLGLKRDLTAGEIVGQFLRDEIEAAHLLDNVVFMGMGEPLLNTQNVFKAIKLLSDPKGRGFSQKRITVSTVGIIPGIEAMIEEGLKVNLAVSLITADTALRSKLVPMEKTYPIKDVIKTAKRYCAKSETRLTFEYVIMEGVNDSAQDAEMLVELIRGIDCRVNLIPYNKVSGKKYSSGQREKTISFQKILKGYRIKALIRKEKGADIDAACGQLAAKEDKK